MIFEQGGDNIIFGIKKVHSGSPLFRAVSIVLLLVLSISSVEGRDKWKLGIGAYYSVGDYDLGSDTEISALSLSASYRHWPWSVKLSTALINLEGPGTISDGEVRNNRRAVKRKKFGVGDSSLKIERSFVYKRSLLWSAGMRMKIPTGNSDNGLGSGAVDFEPRISAFYVGKNFRPYLLVRYTIRGDGSNSTTSLNNALGITFGTQYRFFDDSWLGSSTLSGHLSYRTAASDSGSERFEALLALKKNITANTSLGLFTSSGFSKASPDFLIGFNVGYSWERP